MRKIPEETEHFKARKLVKLCDGMAATITERKVTQYLFLSSNAIEPQS